MIHNNELENNQNPISEIYKRDNNEINLAKNNILKNIGEQLIINSTRALTNKKSHKSIFFHGNNNNKKLKKIYDPYLTNVCKHAIIKEKRELPNYKEIIRNINTEFGIEESEKNNFDRIYNKSSLKNKNKLAINIETNNKNSFSDNTLKRVSIKNKIEKKLIPKNTDRSGSNKKINLVEKKGIDKKELIRIRKRA